MSKGTIEVEITNKVKAIRECEVCGRMFPLIAEEHYIAADPKVVGAIAGLVSTDKANQYDAFDCPHCGCQNVIQPRKPEYCPCDYDICDECCCDEEEDEDAPETPCQKCGKE